MRPEGDVLVLGASGTVLSIAKVLNENCWGAGDISWLGMQKLINRICTNRCLRDLKLPGLNIERSDIFIAGVAILYTLFVELGISRMKTSSQALREGLAYDLIDRGPVHTT